MPKLKVLSFYSFESYIYHPKNILELEPSFDTKAYINDIIQQKNERLISIVAELGTYRQHYIEFKDCIKDDGDLIPITTALQSNEFEVFYPFFNMKKYYPKTFLAKQGFSVPDLSQTIWFKEQILAILQN